MTKFRSFFAEFNAKPPSREAEQKLFSTKTVGAK